ncbi:hypothetical protein ACFXP7_00580 [Microbacterium sp. P06]|uniref:hypothetical protein n=1 Tax=Microbacterium sp. P06 TaxID=3366949 RepID=UPI003746A8A1
MSNRAARASRGAVFAAVATITAAAAHTLGGGAPPSLLYCAILFALATPLAVALASPRPEPWRAALAVGASQLLFHGAFALMGDIGATSGSMMSVTPGHVHDTTMTMSADAAAPAYADMTLLHVLAALVTVALVCRGESALAAIGAWMVRAAAVPAGSPHGPGVPRGAGFIPEPPPVSFVFPPGLGRRGPPASLPSPSAA